MPKKRASRPVHQSDLILWVEGRVDRAEERGEEKALIEIEYARQLIEIAKRAPLPKRGGQVERRRDIRMGEQLIKDAKRLKAKYLADGESAEVAGWNAAKDLAKDSRRSAEWIFERLIRRR